MSNISTSNTNVRLSAHSKQFDSCRLRAYAVDGGHESVAGTQPRLHERHLKLISTRAASVILSMNVRRVVRSVRGPTAPFCSPDLVDTV